MKVFIAIVLLFALLTGASPAPTAANPLDDGYRQMYNLEFGAAHKSFADWEREHPDDPFGPASDAAAYLFTEFERLHILRSDFLTQDSSFLTTRKLMPDPATSAAFEKALALSRTLSREMLKRGQTPERAMFASVVCMALDADYLALIEKENWQALNEVKDATRQAEALVAKYPEDKDAYLSSGVENYLLSQRIGPVRMFLRLTGAQTDKEEGLRKLRIVAEQGHYFKPYAKILLAIAALRDKNKTLAGKLMTQLAYEFPQNDLFKDELKKLSCAGDC
jgi:hypothetical protein